MTRTAKGAQMIQDPGRAQQGTARLRTVLCLVLLACAPAVLFPGTWLRGEVPYPKNLLETTALPWLALHPPGLHVPNHSAGDSITEFIPWDFSLRRDWKSLRPPLWNPWSGGGTPRLGNPETRLFDPIHLLSLAWPPRQAHAVRLALCLVLAGWFMFGLLRHLGAGRSASCFGAAAFQLGGLVVPWLQHPQSMVAAYLPAVVWAGDAVLRDHKRRAILALAVVYALQFLAGKPDCSLHVTTVAALFWLILRFRAGATAWLQLALGLVAGTLLAAPMLLPFLEYLSLSRAMAIRSGIADVLWLPWHVLATFVIPHIFGWPVTGNWCGVSDPIGTVAYVGFVPWLLVPLAFRHPPHRKVAAVLVAVVVLSALIAAGAPGIAWVLNRLPAFSMAANHRMILGVAFGAAALGALGLDALMRRGPRDRRCPWLVAAMALLLLGAAAAVLASSEPGREALRRSATSGWTFFAGGAAGSVLLIALVSRGALHPRAAGLLVVLLAVDTNLAWSGYHPTVPPAEVLPTTPALEALGVRQAPGDRVLALGLKGGPWVLPANTGQAFGLAEIKNLDALRHKEFEDYVIGAMHTVMAAGLQSDYLNLLGARWIAIPVALERFPSAAILWPGQEHTILFPGDEPPEAVVLLSGLVDAPSVAQDQPVAVLEVMDERETIHTFAVRAGRETADESLAAPGFPSSHRPVTQEREFTVLDEAGGQRPCAVFRARLAWSPAWGRARGARLRYQHPEGGLRVQGIGLAWADGRGTLDPEVEPFFRGEIDLYENTRALPRAFLMRGTPENSAIVGLRRHIRPATMLEYEADRVRIAGVAGPGETLVLTDVWFPGWKASIERAGETVKVPITRAFEVFRAVAVPEGSFTVTFRYDPASFRLGLGLLVVGVLVLLAAGCFFRPRGA
ncbi:MAG: hypothetical protein JXQ29_04990 [Planctomycetes bacterium]|nr:hypothetical protein [Planctomycetota bacterium]